MSVIEQALERSHQFGEFLLERIGSAEGFFGNARVEAADIPEQVKASETIKRLLSNLASITQGVAVLRNHYGKGHGKAACAKGLRPRHAKLAVGAASTLAVFLAETHNERAP